MKELHTLCTHSIDKTLLTKVILFYLIFFCFVFSFCCNTRVSMWITNFTLFSILLLFYRVSWSVFNFRTVPKNVRFTSDFMFTAFLLCVESQNRIAHFFAENERELREGLVLMVVDGERDLIGEIFLLELFLLQLF